jgi:hypothetical protein
MLCHHGGIITAASSCRQVVMGLAPASGAVWRCARSIMCRGSGVATVATSCTVWRRRACCCCCCCCVHLTIAQQREWRRTCCAAATATAVRGECSKVVTVRLAAVLAARPNLLIWSWQLFIFHRHSRQSVELTAR